MWASRPQKGPHSVPDPTGAGAARRDAGLNPQPLPRSAPCAGGELTLAHKTNQKGAMDETLTIRADARATRVFATCTNIWRGGADARCAPDLVARTVLALQYVSKSTIRCVRGRTYPFIVWNGFSIHQLSRPRTFVTNATPKYRFLYGNSRIRSTMTSKRYTPSDWSWRPLHPGGQDSAQGAP